MNKKILICGSSIAVVVLVLASLSPVVGYNSVKSSSFKDSPLFSVRTKRANNEEQDALTCDYVGKGRLMPFPIRDSKTLQILNMINTIKSMDDKTFNRFIKQVAHRYQREQMEEVSIDEILAFLYQIRDDTEELNVGEYYPVEFTVERPIICEIYFYIFTAIYFFFVIIFSFILGIFLTVMNKCEPWTNTPPYC